jgi:hypothetical protein
MASITSLPSGVTGSSLVLLSTQTASSSATIDFTSNIDSTYKEYIFKFIDIHPATDGADFSFQADTGTNTSYNQTMTTSAFYSEHQEGGSGSLGYSAARDQAQGSSFQLIADDVGNGNDECCAGTLHLFDPSNTTFVKNFISTIHDYQSGNYAQTWRVAGYFNTTTALTRVRFKFSSGNIDAGTFKLYGVS